MKKMQMQMWLTARRLEWKWRRISRNRKAIGKLLSIGEAYTSQRLVKLEERTVSLGLSYCEMEKRYRLLAEIPCTFTARLE